MYLHIHHIYNYNHNNSSQNKNKNVYFHVHILTWVVGCSMLHFDEPAVLKSDGPP